MESLKYTKLNDFRRADDAIIFLDLTFYNVEKIKEDIKTELKFKIKKHEISKH